MTNTYTVKKLIEELNKHNLYDTVWVETKDNVHCIEKIKTWKDPDDDTISEVTIYLNEIKA